MLTITILDHVTKAMLSKCTPSTTGIMRRSFGSVATKMKNTSGSPLVVCILLVNYFLKSQGKRRMDENLAL